MVNWRRFFCISGTLWLALSFQILGAPSKSRQAGQKKQPPDQTKQQSGAGGQKPANPPAEQPGAQKTLELGEFKDFADLNLDDLLDVKVSIAAGKVQQLEEAPSIVSVITDEDIRRMGARTLEEVLQTVPGYEVLTDNEGRNRLAVRGVVTLGYSENVLVLFNGHRLNEQINGGATVVNMAIPLFNVKQIEIIRGPGSALFGANAFVGVVNIITYSAETFAGTEVSGGGGTFHTQEYSIFNGHTAGKLGIFTSFQFRDTGGPRLLVAEDAQTLVDKFLVPLRIPPASLAPGFTRDARRSYDASAAASYRGFQFNARVRDEDSGGFIGRVDNLARNNKLRNRQSIFDAGYQHKLSTSASLEGKFSFTENRIGEFLEAVPPGFTRPLPNGTIGRFPQGVIVDFDFNTRRYAGEGILDYHPSDNNQLTLGTNVEVESIVHQKFRANFDPLTLGPLPEVVPLQFRILPDISRKIFSFFAQDTWNALPQIGITAGLRYDHYNDFGNTLNPRAGLVWRLPANFHFKALYGRAFRAPTFIELFANAPGALLGDKNLRPSTINTLEFALGYKRKNLRVSGNYFVNYIRNFIAPTKGFAGVTQGVLTFVNSPGLNIQGFETEVKRSFGMDHSIFANYTFQHPEEKGTGFRVADVPSHLANFGGTLGLGRYVSVTPTLLMRSSRPRSVQETLRTSDVDGYALLNVNVRLKNVFETLEFSAAVNNVFDKTYFDSAPLGLFPGDYPRPGRNAFIKVSYKF